MTGIYRHHKGALYAALGTARLSTNGPHEGETVVIYLSLERKHLCVREVAEFTEPIVWPDGVIRPRFVPLEVKP